MYCNALIFFCELALNLTYVSVCKEGWLCKILCVLFREAKHLSGYLILKVFLRNLSSLFTYALPIFVRFFKSFGLIFYSEVFVILHYQIRSIRSCLAFFGWVWRYILPCCFLVLVRRYTVIFLLLFNRKCWCCPRTDCIPEVVL